MSIKEKLDSRHALFVEEEREFYQAWLGESGERALHELVDMLYVLIGHLETMGRAGLKALQEVTDKNNAKMPGDYEQSSDGKIRKKEIGF